MSILLQKGKQTGRRVIVRKAGEIEKGKDACLTCSWIVETEPKQTVRISFSRDIFHVWICGTPVETIASISDQKYDLDLYFDIGPGYKGHIFSDVNDERTKITNYLYVNDERIAQTDLTYDENPVHFKNIRRR